MKPPVTAQAWTALRGFTAARIALGRAGSSQPTAAHLAFQLAHAQARDAVHTALNLDLLAGELEAAGFANPLRLHSAAPDRPTYLQRPDLGRRLDERSRTALEHQPAAPVDLAFVLVDGLSALAVQQHAAPLLALLRQRLLADGNWSWAPPALVEQGRVAVGDEVGALLRARCVVVLVGERPGLSAPDSLGIYFSWAPRPGLQDAQRNCISNVRPEGLPLAAAAAKLQALLTQARARQLTGIGLKDEDDAPPALAGAARLNVLLPDDPPAG